MSEFISLQKATEYCDYTQEYLSLRARQKKLKAQKIGRNWVTTREWLQEYVESAGNHKNGDVREVISQPRRVEPTTPLPFEMESEEIVSQPRRLPVLKLAGVVSLILLFVFSGAFGKEGIVPLLQKIDAGVQGFSQEFDDRVVVVLEFDYTTALQQTAAAAAGGAETFGQGFAYGAKNPAAVGEAAKEYVGWLQTTITGLPGGIAETYEALDSRVASGIQQDVQSIVGLGNSVGQGVQNTSRSLVSIPGNIFGKIAQGIRSAPADVEEEVVVVEEKEEPVKEIVREVEVERIVQVQPVKEVRTEVKTIDSVALLELRSQISTVMAWKTDIDNLKAITSKLQATPPSASQAVAQVYPVYIGSSGIQVGGNGNFSSLGVSGSAGVRDLGVGRSATFGKNSTDTFTVNSTATFQETVTINSTATLSNLTVTGSATLGDASADTVTINAGTVSLIAQATDFDIKDNVASSFTISEAANDYLNITTTNAAETIVFGNATTNPSYSYLGTGGVTIAGSARGTNALTLTAGDLTLTSGDLTLSSGVLAITNPDNNNATAIAVTQNDVTNNPIVVSITNAGTGNALQIDTNEFVVDDEGNLAIVTGTSTVNPFSLTANSIDDETAFAISATALTSGTGISFTGPSGATVGITGNVLSLVSDLGSAGELINLSGTIDTMGVAESASLVTAVLTNSNSTNANTVYGYNLDLNDAVALGNTNYGYFVDLDNTGATTANKTVYGMYSDVVNTGATGGTQSTYAGYFTATGDTGGTSSVYGLYTVALAGDTGYGLYVADGSSTTNYAIYVADQTGETTDYGIYLAGADTAAIYVAADPVVLADDVFLNLGANSDIVALNRSDVLIADTTLTNVIEGTPETPAVAANSLILSNITNDGDILFAVSKAGSSQGVFWADGSTGDTAIMASSGQSVDIYIAGTKEIDYSTGAMAFQQATTISTTMGALIIDGDDGITLQTTGSGDVTIAENTDIEGYVAIGNGSSLSAATTLIIDRDFTAPTGSSPGVVSIASQTITENGGAGTHPLVTGLSVSAPTITDGTHSVTTAATVYINNATAATGANNYALLVEAGDVIVDDNLVVGGSTSRTETLLNTGFVFGGNDLFVAGLAGIEGNVYTDGSFIAGATTTYGDGSITGSAALVISSGGSSDITLDSAGDITIAAGDDIVFTDGNSDIGTAGTRAGFIYANEVNATTLVGTLTGGNLTAATFTINSDNSTPDDTEDSNLAFERGDLTPNALITWDSALGGGPQEFDFNSGIHITGTIASTTGLTLEAFTTELAFADTTPTITIGNTGTLTITDGTNTLFSIADDTSEGDVTITGDLAINGATAADITSSTATVNLFNATPTTLNIGGAATTVSLGAGSGTSTVNNALTVTGVFTANGNIDLGNANTDTLSLIADIDTSFTFDPGATRTITIRTDNTAGDKFDIAGGSGGIGAVAGGELSLTGGAAGSGTTGGAGGPVSVSGGAADGTGDNAGGDVVLIGGTATGSGNIGVVRVGSPTIASTRAVDLLAVGGGLEVDGATQLDGALTISTGGASITGDLTLDGDLDFTGAQEITTSSGDLTLNPSGDLQIQGDVFTGTNNGIVINHSAILTPGNVAALLQVHGTDTSGSAIGAVRYATGNNVYSQLILGKSSVAAIGSYGNLGDDEDVGRIRFAVSDSTPDLNSIAAEIIVQMDAAAGSNDTPGRIIFATTAVGADAATERLRIDSAGAMIVGPGEQGTTAQTGNTLRGINLSGGTDQAGADLTIAAGAGTGTGDVGQLIFQTPRVGSTGATPHTVSTLMALDEGQVNITGDLDVSGNSAFGDGASVSANSIIYAKDAWANNENTLYGVYADPTVQWTTGTPTNIVRGINARVTLLAASSVNNTATVGIRALEAGVDTSGSPGTKMTGVAGLYVRTPPVGLDAVNNYGIYIENQSTADNDYGIYIAGADDAAIFVAGGGMNVTGDFTLDGDLDFIGPQEISTSSGDLTINTAGNVNISSGDLTVNGHLGVAGTAVSADIGINTSESYTDPGATGKTGGTFNVTFNDTSGGPFTAIHRGSMSKVTLRNTNTQSNTATVGLRGLQALIDTVGTPTGTITGAAAIYISATPDNLPVTNMYGIYIEAQTTGSSLNHAIKSLGTAESTSTTTGDIVTAGGIGVAKDVYIGGGLIDLASNQPTLFLNSDHTSVVSGTVISQIRAAHNDGGTAGVTNITFVGEGIAQGSDTATGIGFWVTAAGSATYGEKVRISNRGYLQIGTQSDTGRNAIDVDLSDGTTLVDNSDFRNINSVGFTQKVFTGFSLSKLIPNAFNAPTYDQTSGTDSVADAATVYISGAPVATNNFTITSPWALWIDNGASRFDGELLANSTSLFTDYIGATPSYQFHGADDQDDATIAITSWSATGDYPAQLILAKSNSNTIGDDLAADDNDTVGDILWQHTDSVGTNRIAAIKVTVDDSAPGVGNRTGGQMVIGVTDGVSPIITNTITLNSAGLITIGAANTPASTAGSTGTASPGSITATGGLGGNTTVSTTGIGGIGGGYIFTGGAGGVASAATTSATGGAGGAYTLTAGAGGLSSVAGTGTNTGGAGGALSFTAGTGGNATTGTGTLTGGQGGNLSLTAGNAGTGGNANGGNITLTAGTATGSGTRGIINIPDNNGLVIGHTANAFGSGQDPALQVAGTTGNNDTMFGVARFSNDITGPQILLAKTRGTSIGSNTVVQLNDELGRIEWQGGDGSGFLARGAQIIVYSDGTAGGGGDMPARMSFRTSADGSGAPTERLLIDSVGLATFAGNVTLGANSLTAGSILANSDDVGAIGASGTAFSDLFLASGAVINWNAGDVTITHEANKLRIQGATSGYTFENGNVGIGNDTPGRLLEVSTSGAATQVEFSTWSTVNSQASTIYLQKSASATINTLAETASGSTLGVVGALGVDTGSAVRFAAQIVMSQDAAADADAVPGRIVFNTSTLTGLTERLRINSAGNVGIGTATPLFNLDIAGDAILGTRGSEKVTNTDFSGTGCNAAWVFGAGWACDDGNDEADATASSATLTQDTTETAGEIYQVTFTLKNFSAGTVTVSIGTISGTARSANGTYIEVITSNGSSDLTFTASGFTGSIDDVSVKRLTSGDLFVAGNVGIGTTAPLSAGLDIRTSGSNQLVLNDSAAVAADVGGTILFRGTYKTAGDFTDSGKIIVGKTNASAGNFSFYMAFSTRLSGSSVAERMRILDTGFVGIGTTGPGRALEINHATGSNLRLTYNDADGGATNYTDLTLASSGELTLDSSGFGVIIPDGDGLVIGHTAQQTIGGITPEVQILGLNDNVDTMLAIGRWSANTSGTGLNFLKSRDTTIGSFTKADSGDTVVRLLGLADDGTDYASQVAEIRYSLDAVTGMDDTPGRITFYTTADGAATGTERLRIDSSGGVGIGAAAAAGTKLNISYLITTGHADEGVSPTYGLKVDHNKFSTGAATVYGAFIEAEATQWISNQTVYGLYALGNATKPNSSGETYGVDGLATYTNGSDATALVEAVGVRAQAKASGSTAVITSAYAFKALAGVTVSGSTITTNYGLHVANPDSTGTIVTNYGVYVADQTGGDTNDYGLYIGGGETYALWVDTDTARFDDWIVGNQTIPGDVNMFKMNASGEIEVGAALSLGGGLSAAEDSGAITIFDMPVSGGGDPAAGTEMSATFKIDSDNILTVYAEADGSGGVQNTAVLVKSAIDSTSTTTGSLQTLGGLGVAKDIVLGATSTIFIGDTSNAQMTAGLTINIGANDDQTLAFKSSDVIHAMTGLVEDDTFGRFQKANPDAGGLLVEGFRDADGPAGEALSLQGSLGEAADTGSLTTSVAVVKISGRITDGGTSTTAVADAGNVFAIENNGSIMQLWKGNGDAIHVIGRIIVKDTTDATTTDGLTGSIQTLGGASIKLSAEIGGGLNVGEPLSGVAEKRLTVTELANDDVARFISKDAAGFTNAVLRAGALSTTSADYDLLVLASGNGTTDPYSVTQFKVDGVGHVTIGGQLTFDASSQINIPSATSGAFQIDSGSTAFFNIESRINQYLFNITIDAPNWSKVSGDSPGPGTMKIATRTYAYTGNNAITNTNGYGLYIDAPTVTGDTATLTITNASTLYIANINDDDAEVTITNNYAINTEAGFSVSDTARVIVNATVGSSTAGLCWSGTSGAAQIEDCNGAPSDLAENFGTSDTTIEAGDIVVATGTAELAEVNGLVTSKAYVAKSTAAYESAVIGVVSTQPNQLYGTDGLFEEADNPRPVSLAGRLPVKVSTENGSIQTGDLITSSSVPGVGMKATQAGKVVGVALQPYDGIGVGSVIVFINPHWQGGDLSVTEAGGTLTSIDPEQLRTSLASLGLVVNTNGILEVDTLIARKVTLERFEVVDARTGELYCSWLEYGEWVKVQGECNTITIGGGSTLVDTTPPVISLAGVSPVEIVVGDAYTDAGATATDDVDGDITASIIVDSTVDTTIIGSYSVSYNVSDAAGNAATPVTRSVNVVDIPSEPAADTTPPVITLIGSSLIEVEVGAVYVDEGATATDDVDGDITTGIVTVSTVDTATAGTYIVTYNVSDAAGNTAAEIIRTVDVVEVVPTDTTVPVITLLGSGPVELIVGDTYIEDGATAVDDIDGDITAGIVIVSTVDTTTEGSYSVTYNVSDAAGNAAVEVTRTVNVTAPIDVTPPVITLIGSSPVELIVGDAYTDAGATATDDVDGDITADIVTVSTVDTATVGTYSVTYNVSDTAGNAATEVVRTVNVSDAP